MVDAVPLRTDRQFKLNPPHPVQQGSKCGEIGEN
jgi:hypothetical protein